MPLKYEDSTDNDDSDVDPGRDVIERNQRNRLQRMATHTKDELNKVLRRVDLTLTRYEDSVQSTLVQHGMTHQEMTNVEHVADIKELENLLNDKLAKQKYKQRLMVFIVGQTEQVMERSKLLQQIEQFFSEQKRSFSAAEFNNYDEKVEQPDEVDLTLKSFDIKDCYVHVKSLGTRLNELNEEIIQHLVQTAVAKQQAKGKKKGNQLSKETKEQLASLQSKLDAANADAVAKFTRIEELEGSVAALTEELQKGHDSQEKLENDVKRFENQIESLKKSNSELEESIEQYQNQIEDLERMVSKANKPTTTAENANEAQLANEETDQQSLTEIDDSKQIPLTTTPNQQSFVNKNQMENAGQLQLIRPDSLEPLANLNTIFNPPAGIDLHDVTIDNLPDAYANLREFAIMRVRELLKELEITESKTNETIEHLKQEFDDYKTTHEKERSNLIEVADNAFKLQMKAQTTAEEAMNHLKIYMSEHETAKPLLIHQETQTNLAETVEQRSDAITIASSEVIDPIEESVNDRLSSYSKTLSEDAENSEISRQPSLKDKYMHLLEEKQQELEHLKHLAEMVLSRPGTSIEEKTTYQEFESLTGVESAIKQDQEQQTSDVGEKDVFRTAFFHAYEIILKFRQSMVHVLEQNKLSAFADRLQTIKALSIGDNPSVAAFSENVEYILRDVIKVIQTSMAVYVSTISEHEAKEKEFRSKPLKAIQESSSVDPRQSAIVQEKEAIIRELDAKYKQLAEILAQTNKDQEEEENERQRLVLDQQKYIEALQHELTHLQQRLIRIENEGVIEPSILFTRLDAQRNEETLKQAADKGKVPDTTCDELMDAMKDYVNIPSRQLNNLVKQYVQFRKATALEDQIRSEVFDEETKTVLEKMENLHERRSAQIHRKMSAMRQQRVDLAKTLTAKFDHLEEESSIFLIRPIYSCQGRAAVKSYMKRGKERVERLSTERQRSNPRHPSRQSLGEKSASSEQNTNQHFPMNFSSAIVNDEDERLFHMSQSYTTIAQTVSHVTSSLPISADATPIIGPISDMSRLQELDIQRTLMPMSHTSTSLLSAFTNSALDPYVPSLNLRSYVALSRPGVSHFRRGKPNDIITPVSRDGQSTLSAKSQAGPPRTPFNSGVIDGRRMSPALPPIRRTMASNVLSSSSSIDEAKTKNEMLVMN